MQLKSLQYAENEAEPGEWILRGLLLRNQNLMVGVNASGKTRALALINNLARVIAGDLKPAFSSGTRWDACFDNNGVEITYRLAVRQNHVEQEEFLVKGETLLKRGTGGSGTIRFEKTGQDMDFQSPETDAAIVNRRDSIQHSFFEPLYQWGHNVYSYGFGSDFLGKTTVMVQLKGVIIPEFDPRDTTKTSAIYQKGETRFGDDFKNAIKRDMERLRYPIDEIGMRPANVAIVPLGPIPFGPPQALYVQEHDLTAPTDQITMSNGMFRALALVVQLNYARLAAQPSCILIDDIGEGLDFERSCLLIELMRGKAAEANVQLVMSTNDRFVMNSVPLEDWSVLRRTGGLVTVHNYENSKDVFDEFKITGLNNFDFFRMDFVSPSKEQPHD